MVYVNRAGIRTVCEKGIKLIGMKNDRALPMRGHTSCVMNSVCSSARRSLRGQNIAHMYSLAATYMNSDRGMLKITDKEPEKKAGRTTASKKGKSKKPAGNGGEGKDGLESGVPAGNKLSGAAATSRRKTSDGDAPGDGKFGKVEVGDSESGSDDSSDGEELQDEARPNRDEPSNHEANDPTTPRDENPPGSWPADGPPPPRRMTEGLGTVTESVPQYGPAEDDEEPPDEPPPPEQAKYKWQVKTANYLWPTSQGAVMKVHFGAKPLPPSAQRKYKYDKDGNMVHDATNDAARKSVIRGKGKDAFEKAKNRELEAQMLKDRVVKKEIVALGSSDVGSHAANFQAKVGEKGTKLAKKIFGGLRSKKKKLKEQFARAKSAERPGGNPNSSSSRSGATSGRPSPARESITRISIGSDGRMSVYTGSSSNVQILSSGNKPQSRSKREDTSLASYGASNAQLLSSAALATSQSSLSVRNHQSYQSQTSVVGYTLFQEEMFKNRQSWLQTGRTSHDFMAEMMCGVPDSMNELEDSEQLNEESDFKIEYKFEEVDAAKLGKLNADEELMSDEIVEGVKAKKYIPKKYTDLLTLGLVLGTCGMIGLLVYNISTAVTAPPPEIRVYSHGKLRSLADREAGRSAGGVVAGAGNAEEDGNAAAGASASSRRERRQLLDFGVEMLLGGSRFEVETADQQEKEDLSQHQEEEEEPLSADSADADDFWLAQMPGGVEEEDDQNPEREQRESGQPSRRRVLAAIDSEFEAWVARNKELSRRHPLDKDLDYFAYNLHLEILGDFLLQDVKELLHFDEKTFTRLVRTCPEVEKPEFLRQAALYLADKVQGVGAEAASEQESKARGRICEKLDKLRKEFLLGFFKFIYSEAYEAVKDNPDLHLSLSETPQVAFLYVPKYEFLKPPNSMRSPYFSEDRIVLKIKLKFPKTGYDYHSQGMSGSPILVAGSQFPLGEHVFRKFCNTYQNDADDSLGVFFLRAVEFAGAEMSSYSTCGSGEVARGDSFCGSTSMSLSSASTSSAKLSTGSTPSAATSLRKRIRERFYLYSSINSEGPGGGEGSDNPVPPCDVPDAGTVGKVVKGCVTDRAGNTIKNAHPCDGRLVGKGVCAAHEIDEYSCFCDVGFAPDAEFRAPYEGNRFWSGACVIKEDFCSLTGLATEKNAALIVVDDEGPGEMEAGAAADAAAGEDEGELEGSAGAGGENDGDEAQEEGHGAGAAEDANTAPPEQDEKMETDAGAAETDDGAEAEADTAEDEENAPAADEDDDDDAQEDGATVHRGARRRLPARPRRSRKKPRRRALGGTSKSTMQIGKKLKLRCPSDSYMWSDKSLEREREFSCAASTEDPVTLFEVPAGTGGEDASINCMKKPAGGNDGHS
eukprot:g9513.t1